MTNIPRCLKFFLHSAFKSTIKLLQNEVTALKQQQNETEEKTEENINLKQDLISTTDKINTFNLRYNNLEMLSNLYNNSHYQSRKK